jgi:hypothetical protein
MAGRRRQNARVKHLGVGLVAVVVGCGEDPEPASGDTSTAGDDVATSSAGDDDTGDGSTAAPDTGAADGASTGCGAPTTWFADVDGDGFGDPDTAMEACTMPAGHVDNDADCNDGNSDLNPDAAEICDRVDNDCDGDVDEVTCVECTWTTEASGRREWGLCTGGLAWSDARAHCQAEGGDLVSLHGPSENLFAVNVLVTTPDAWIGLHDMDREGVFVWSDGTPLDYENWEDGQPDDADATQNCIEIGPSRRWFDGSCDDELPFLCVRPVR